MSGANCRAYRHDAQSIAHLRGGLPPPCAVFYDHAGIRALLRRMLLMSKRPSAFIPVRSRPSSNTAYRETHGAFGLKNLFVCFVYFVVSLSRPDRVGTRNPVTQCPTGPTGPTGRTTRTMRSCRNTPPTGAAELPVTPLFPPCRCGSGRSRCPAAERTACPPGSPPCGGNGSSARGSLPR